MFAVYPRLVNEGVFRTSAATTPEDLSGDLTPLRCTFLGRDGIVYVCCVLLRVFDNPLTTTCHTCLVWCLVDERRSFQRASAFRFTFRARIPSPEVRTICGLHLGRVLGLRFNCGLGFFRRILARVTRLITYVISIIGGRRIALVYPRNECRYGITSRLSSDV